MTGVLKSEKGFSGYKRLPTRSLASLLIVRLEKVHGQGAEREWREGNGVGWRLDRQTDRLCGVEGQGNGGWSHIACMTLAGPVRWA